MVFKPINLARQSFVKTFTHSYAQSLVAASHPSSATQNPSFHTISNNFASFFSKNASSGSQLQNAHQNLPTANGASANAKSSQLDTSGQDSGLAAYYAAWQKHQRPEEKEWHQFQFAKRIGWRAPTTIPEGQPKSAEAVKPVNAHERDGSRPLIERSHSTSALDDLKKNAEEEYGDFLSATLEGEAAVKAYEEPVEALFSSAASASVSVDVSQEEDFSSGSVNSSTSPTAPSTSEPQSTTPPSSISESELKTLQLADLAESQRYAEIPAVFESMLGAGIKPSSSAYNALLLAAINLPRGKHQVVPKVLDVYSDMLRRRVSPDTATYAILIELLAARALDVSAMKTELEEKLLRYGGMDEQGSFMFRSDETEYQIVSEDESLNLAIKLFDTAAAVSTRHIFPPETYHSLICACAEHGRIGDMVRIYAHMESQDLTPPTQIFAPMIRAFAKAGDLRSSVECYDEYKALAVSNDEGLNDIIRQDEQVYAAVVKAYALCGRTNGGLKFLGKIEDSMENSERLPIIRDTVALQTLHPEWLAQDQHQEALDHAAVKLTSNARQSALSTITMDAADKNRTEIAANSLNQLLEASSNGQISLPTSAVLAMHIRNGDVESAKAVWKTLEGLHPSVALVDPTTMFALSLVGSGEFETGLKMTRRMFAGIRNHATTQQTKADAVDRIDEAIQVVSQYLFGMYPTPPSVASMELLWTMVENGDVMTPLAERCLATLGPETISQMSLQDVNMLTQIQAGILINTSSLDVAHVARFAHLMELVGSTGAPVEHRTSTLIQQALVKIDRPELSMKWQSLQYQPSTPLLSPVQYRASVHQSPTSLSPYAYEDSYDPYGSSTDFRGSTFIAEELDKTYGRHAAHLNEAMTRFKNMRRAGRHPRYATYAKLINAAAKENRMNLAQDILAMARQDVPYLPSSRVVHNGWVSILDSMVGACLQVGHRETAAQFHQELLNMGAAPSANTFGLYITTLKESTKTFDEATEAVKIFHRAKNEGVEPTSFLYNALIGKLGKARRIDDCLFYFAEMRNLGIRPTSVTYGTVVNALCRVSDDKFAEELFEEMESMPNYKPRPAPYNSLMQYFLTTKRDRSKVLAYYNRMRANNIAPTMHTFKLLIDTHATLEPVDMRAAEEVLDSIRPLTGSSPEAVHYASLIHAKGCAQHDLAGARAVFDKVLSEGAIAPHASLYQALFESMVANHDVDATEPLLKSMTQDHRVAMTPYIANTLIHGWSHAGDLAKARQVYDALGKEKREPSTYEAMTRAYLAVGEHGLAKAVVGEALRRGYPSAVAGKICELVQGGGAAPTTTTTTTTTATAAL